MDGLLFLGGLIIIVLDGPWSPLLPWLRKRVLIVTTVAGRGIFQLLVAFLALSQGTTPQFPFSLRFFFAPNFCFAICAGWDKFTFTDPWSDIPSVLYLGTALVLLVLGVTFLVAGVGALRS